MRAFLICATIFFAVTTIVLRKTVFGLSVTKVDPTRFDGTQAMADRLRELALGVDPNRVYSEQVPIYALLARYFTDIKEPPDDKSRILLEAKAAEKALQKGDAQEAVSGFLRVRTAASAHPELFDAQFHHALGRQLAIAWLRFGEQQNCVAMHNGESCILPIAGAGVHTLQDGARNAMKEYLALLDQFPDDLDARWLLNVTYMTVGEYPDKVPAKWLIPPRAFASDLALPRFQQIASEVGLDLEGVAGGVIIDDFDGDGHLDLVVSRMMLNDKGQIRFFHNDGDGRFTERTREAGLLGITGGLNIVQTDYDNDGALDIVIPRGAWAGPWGNLPMSLLHNDGHGHFSDVTVKAGLLAFHPTQAVVWADFDNDGFVDLFVARETFTLGGLWSYLMVATDAQHDHPPGVPSFKRHPCALYHNNGNGTFTDVAADAGVDLEGYFKGAIAIDYDNDGKMDLYISNLMQANTLLHNDGHLRFSDVSRRAGVGAPVFSFPTWSWDYDNDGWEDLFVGDSPSHLGVYAGAGLTAASYLGQKPPSKPKATSSLYHNNHDGTFSDVSAAVGLDKILQPMGCNFGDLDNDGWLDFYLGTGNPSYEVLVPNRMFRNNEGRRFQDVTTAGGFGHLQKGHAIAFGDLDDDGDQDVYAVMGGAFTGDVAHNALFENPGSAGNHFLKLQLVGTRSNRAAIGARVRVTVASESGATRDIYSTVSSGSSFGSSSFRRELGLGRAAAIRAVQVTWPATGKTQRFENVAMDRFYRVHEGAASLEPLPLTPFKLGGAR
ncbi:MAG: CRTAC1 family protein [Polyangia bacterium]